MDQNQKKQTKLKKLYDSPVAGPSHFIVCDDDDDDDDDASNGFSSDSTCTEEEKCCVCGLFIPTGIRNSVSLVFTKWAKYDLCDHWVHLIYCTEVRVVRRGDSFVCPHCKEE